MQIVPNIAFGRGFVSSKMKLHNAPVYAVNVSNGMPIVPEKKPLVEIIKPKGHKIKKQ